LILRNDAGKCYTKGQLEGSKPQATRPTFELGDLSLLSGRARPSDVCTRPTMDTEPKKQPYRDLPELDPGEQVAVAVFDAPHEAHLAVLHLETQGIAAHVTNDLVVGMAPHLGVGMAGVRVMVAERDAADAHEHLENLRIEVQKEQRARREHEHEPTDAAGRTSPTGLLLGIGVLLLSLVGWIVVNTVR